MQVVIVGVVDVIGVQYKQFEFVFVVFDFSFDSFFEEVDVCEVKVCIEVYDENVFLLFQVIEVIDVFVVIFVRYMAQYGKVRYGGVENDYI